MCDEKENNCVLYINVDVLYTDFNVVWLHVAFCVYDLVILVYVAIVWFHVSTCLFTLSETKNKICTLINQWYQIYDAHRIFTQYQG